MSCNTFIPIMDLVREVEALIAANYIDKDDPRIINGVFTSPTIRGDFLLDGPAKEAFCAIVQQCGISAPPGKIWVPRPLAPDTFPVSYTDDVGDIYVKWIPTPATPEIPDLTDTIINIVPMVQGQITRTQSSKNLDSMHVKDFGAKCDGVTDDTEAWRRGLQYSEATGGALNLSGKILIKDEYVVTKKITLRGNGAEILFDNADATGPGIATKGVLRFTGYLKANRSSVDGVSIYHLNQTVKSQNTIIFDNSYIIDLTLTDITVYNATGYILYLIGDSVTPYNPAFHHLVADGVRGYTVGGLVGQADNTTTWCTGAELSRFNQERANNAVSPATTVANLKGFRESILNSWILEGGGHALTRTGIFIDSPAVTLNNMYIEVTTNPLDYAIHAINGITINNLAFHAEGGIKLGGRGHSILNGVNTVGVGGGISVEGAASYTLNHSYIHDDYWGINRPSVGYDKIGNVEVIAARNETGASYNHRPNLEIYKLPVGTTKTINETTTTRKNSFTMRELHRWNAEGNRTTMVSAYDDDVGRIVTLTNPNNNPMFSLAVDIPKAFEGAQMIIAARVRLRSSVPITGKGIQLIDRANVNYDNVVGPLPPTGALAPITMIDTELTKDNTWQNMYVVINKVRNNTLNSVLFSNPQVVDPSADLKIDILDLKITLGRDLPTLSAGNHDPVILYDSKIPTMGYYMQGDIIYNTGTTDVVGWHRKTTGTDNTLGTDWVAFGEPVTEEIPTLTSGPTDQRPTGVEVGFNYFDTTLAIPIYYKAAGEWVNSTGEVV